MNHWRVGRTRVRSSAPSVSHRHPHRKQDRQPTDAARPGAIVIEHLAFRPGLRHAREPPTVGTACAPAHGGRDSSGRPGINRHAAPRGHRQASGRDRSRRHCRRRRSGDRGRDLARSARSAVHRLDGRASDAAHGMCRPRGSRTYETDSDAERGAVSGAAVFGVAGMFNSARACRSCRMCLRPTMPSNFASDITGS